MTPAEDGEKTSLSYKLSRRRPEIQDLNLADPRVTFASMNSREPVTHSDVHTVADLVVGALKPNTDRDWMVPAGRLEWSCWDTAEHIAGVGLVYAAQLAIRKQEGRYARLYPRLFPEPAPVEVCESIEAAYRLLAYTVQAAPTEVRAYHPYGSADAEGFAAIASAEALVHTHDIMSGLGLVFEPDPEVSRRLLARTFPEAPDTGDPWAGLLQATGRTGDQPPTTWRWHAAPVPVDEDGDEAG